MAWWFRRRSEPDDEVVSVRLPASHEVELPRDEELAELTAGAEQGDDVAMGNLAAVLHRKGDQAGALHWWGRAWEAGNVVAGFNLGMQHAVAGDANRAQVVWEKVAALGDPDAMLGLVKQALDRGDAAGVERWVPVILAQDEAFPITALGVAFREHGDLARAVQAFLRAEELGDGYAMEYRARILAARGQHEEAEALRARAATAERML
ncbi:hypothetical protein [Kitasatospora viridis]|uniref:Tetratricopeptide repeat protein n=1 Tax=Kitasatospora viridis TaxID=281105 RepID=A0A561TSC7_9ACTN|nr:hypothetical protein [Kitasatospora viridis]TWF90016.1 hypothetical protein FHX73_1360 [Kitasatospora viridis]